MPLLRPKLQQNMDLVLLNFTNQLLFERIIQFSMPMQTIS